MKRKRKEKEEGTIKKIKNKKQRQESPKLQKCTQSQSLSNNTADQEERQSPKTKRSVKADESRLKCEKTKTPEVLEQQDSHTKHKHSNQGASPHASPGPSSSQQKRNKNKNQPSGAATGKATDQPAAASTFTLQQNSADWDEGEDNCSGEGEPWNTEDRTGISAAPIFTEDGASDDAEDLSVRDDRWLERPSSKSHHPTLQSNIVVHH